MSLLSEFLRIFRIDHPVYPVADEFQSIDEAVAALVEMTRTMRHYKVEADCLRAELHSRGMSEKQIVDTIRFYDRALTAQVKRAG
jgi:sulfur relay (sulfurtransferase) DsrF/TusC family protein